ncbi:MAG: hydantoinase B/oxoprolinase family protein, partial [Candidatus Rokuibacteriota bacterium]
MATRTFDPVTLQILWNRLIGIVDEGAITLVRTSFSSVVQECNDYACVIMDARGRGLADNPRSIPAFIGTLPRTTRALLEELPPETWAPGDVVVTNDPWLGTGHLPDFSLVAPVFHRDRLVAFAGSVAHAADVGGINWGSHAREVFEEGIRIPVSKLFEAGRPNRQLLRILEANVRVPEQVIGDLFAQVAAVEVCQERVGEFLADAGLEDLEVLAEAIQQHGEQSMRAAIRAVPDGVYEHAVPIDGFEETLTVRCRVTVDGDRLDVDYAGTSPQVPHGVNSPMSYTYAYTKYPLKCALDPLTPKNEGSYLPLSVRAPAGSILNATFPAPVSARHLSGMYCAAAVFGALARAIPDRVMADSSGPPARPIFAGTDRDGKPFSLIVFPWGGMGARPTADGLACTAYPGNDACASVEVMETLAPVRFHEKQLVRDSGGVGKFEGGAGQRLAIELVADRPATLSIMSARFRTPANGLLGGGPGSLTEVRINGQPVAANARHVVQPGDVVTLGYPGGGGYGDPR